MATAGKVLIMPKGEYNAETTYEMLDLVKHHGTSWLAKQTVKGIAPSNENSEYWHNMFDVDTVVSSSDCNLMKPDKGSSKKWYIITKGENMPKSGVDTWSYMVCVYALSETTFIQEAICISPTDYAGCRYTRYYSEGSYSRWVDGANEIRIVRNSSEFENKPMHALKDAFEKGEITSNSHHGIIFCASVFAFTGYYYNSYGSWLVHTYGGQIYHVAHANGNWAYREVNQSGAVSF